MVVDEQCASHVTPQNTAGVNIVSDVLSENFLHRVKCHKIIMIYPQPVSRHYHPKYTLITLAPVSYLRSLVVRAVHGHRTGVGSIPAGGPYS